MLRSILRRVPESKRDDVFRSMTASLASGSTYDGGDMSSLTDIDKPLTMSLKYHALTWATPTGDFLLAPLPWADLDGNSELEATIGPKRTQDLDVSLLAGITASTLELTLPAGYVPQQVPEDVHQSSSWGSYSFAYRLDGNKLTIERKVEINVLRIPASDLQQFLAYLQVQDKRSNQPIVLKKA